MNAPRAHLRPRRAYRIVLCIQIALALAALVYAVITATQDPHRAQWPVFVLSVASMLMIPIALWLAFHPVSPRG